MDDLINKEEEKFCLDRSVLNITARCTLKCKLCVMGCPYYEKPPHYSYEELSNVINRFFCVVDKVRWYEFSGGETFLHPELPQLIEHVMKYRDQFDRLLIFTNATTLLNEKLEKVLLKYSDKVLFMISHYGIHSKYAEELKSWFDEHKIECVVKKYYGEDQHCGGWLDYGDFTKLNRSEDELQEVYCRCGATKMNGCFTTHGGEMHWCVPSARGMRILGKIPRREEDFIDLLDDSLSVEEQRNKIKNLISRKHITACDYCMGDFGEGVTPRYPAAEQLSRKNI